jgi:hypothetical protein
LKEIVLWPKWISDNVSMLCLFFPASNTYDMSIVSSIDEIVIPCLYKTIKSNLIFWPIFLTLGSSNKGFIFFMTIFLSIHFDDLCPIGI